MGKVVCPICEKDDQIQKVTSIVTSGVATSHYQVDGFAGNSGTSTSQTQLAHRLSPPEVPGFSSGTSLNSSTTSALVVGIGVIFGCIFQWISGVSFFTKDTPFWIGFVVGIAGIIGLFLVSVIKTKKKIPNLKIQFARWSSLYYCYRDDCVFDPKTNKHTSPEGMDRLL